MASTRASRSLIDLTMSSTAGSSNGGRSKGKAAASKATIICSEVIEISDSDEENISVPAKRKSSTAELERQLKKLKQENDKYRRQEKKLKEEIQTYQQDIAQLRASAQATTATAPSSGSKDQIPISELEDNVTCEICTFKMWTPYILPECGHTFCLDCLQDWFSTTLAQHMTAHPNYNVNRRNHYAQYEYANDFIQLGQFHPHMAPYLHQQAGPPPPEYTCPTCRTRVRNPPVEDFSLKAIVWSVAAAQGESSPRKKATKQQGKKRSGKGGPWDGFFPRERT